MEIKITDIKDTVINGVSVHLPNNITPYEEDYFILYQEQQTFKSGGNCTQNGVAKNSVTRKSQRNIRG